MNIILILFFILLFCIDYCLVYEEVVRNNKHLNERQRAYIMSIKASVTMFLIGVYYNYKFFTSKSYNIDDSVDNISFINLSILNLIAYFISDCLVGYYKYHNYLCSLSGYFHHIIYICISILSLKLNVVHLYILFFIEELPTLILSLGQYNYNMRSDTGFGITFFLTRILYHCYLLYYTYNSHILFIIFGFLSLILHTFWFKNWLLKYTLLFKKD